MKKKIVLCKFCEKEFEGKGWGANYYCSIECREANYKIIYSQKRKDKIKSRLVDKICDHCDSIYQTTRSDRRFCSPKCKVEYEKERKKVQYPPKKCPVCAKEFIPKRITRTYCSQKCIDQRRSTKKIDHLPKRVRTELRLEVIREHSNTCWLCQKEFEDEDLIEIHHLDGEGYKENPNNTLENLVPLHRSCHKLFHLIFVVRRKDKWFIQGAIFNMLGLEGSIEIVQ